MKTHYDTKVEPVRALLVCPNITANPHIEANPKEYPLTLPSNARSFQAKLEEALRLAASLGLNMLGHDTPLVKNIKAATFIGGGHIERLHDKIEAEEIALLIVDTALSPIQQRNLERALDCKVIDRTGLILEIFSKRARTHEGRLQVELAALNFQRTRLVRSWTHLERQRGGFGFTGGPGERQIELDRRIIDGRIQQLNSDIQKVKRTRSLHRQARNQVPFPIVALVGYTNAGKSTLFNRLTKAEVMAKDMLFATLDPTMRALTLPQGKEKIILSDTVGFITDLPHELIAAFQATLEEVENADIILHIRDAASPAYVEEAKDVHQVLERLNIKKATPIIDIYNKIDLVENASHHKSIHENSIKVSALTGAGLDQLYQAISDALSRNRIKAKFHLNPEILKGHYGAAYAFIHQYGQNITLSEALDDQGSIVITLEWNPMHHHRFMEKFALHPEYLEDSKQGG